MARETAQMALRVLRGEHVQNIPPQQSQSILPMVDWRQLRHWGIAGLPADTVVRCEPTLGTLLRRIFGLLAHRCSDITDRVVLFERSRRWRATRGLVESEERYGT